MNIIQVLLGGSNDKLVESCGAEAEDKAWKLCPVAVPVHAPAQAAHIREAVAEAAKEEAEVEAEVEK